MSMLLPLERRSIPCWSRTVAKLNRQEPTGVAVDRGNHHQTRPANQFRVSGDARRKAHRQGLKIAWMHDDNLTVTEGASPHMTVGCASRSPSPPSTAATPASTTAFRTRWQSQTAAQSSSASAGRDDNGVEREGLPNDFGLQKAHDASSSDAGSGWYVNVPELASASCNTLVRFG
jgi:hypothetical protein